MKLSGKNVSELHLQAISNIITKRSGNHSDGNGDDGDGDRDGLVPKLAFFLVGNRIDSRLYVNIKKKMCDRVGIQYDEYLLPESTTSSVLAEKINNCNNDNTVNGIIIQLPLPDHLPEENLLQMVSPDKDVDGFHALNIARLVSRPVMTPDELEEQLEENTSIGMDQYLDNTSSDNITLVKKIQKKIVSYSRREKGFLPCTPKGIVTLLDSYNFKSQGKKAVIVGCGRVGRPLGLMLLTRGMTVDYIDRYSRRIDMIKRVREADLLVVAVGIRGIIDSGLISSDTVVVDVGIHQTPTGKTVGDLVLKNLLQNEKDGLLTGVSRTPVPGGVGPMTVAMLLENTVVSWIRMLEKDTHSTQNQSMVLGIGN